MAIAFLVRLPVPSGHPSTAVPGSSKLPVLIGLPFFAQLHQLRQDCILFIRQNEECIRTRYCTKLTMLVDTQPLLVRCKDGLVKQKLSYM